MFQQPDKGDVLQSKVSVKLLVLSLFLELLELTLYIS